MPVLIILLRYVMFCFNCTATEAGHDHEMNGAWLTISAIFTVFERDMDVDVERDTDFERDPTRTLSAALYSLRARGRS